MRPWPMGSEFYGNTSGACRHETWQAFGPTEYRCYIKEDHRQYATAGADFPPQATCQSSTTQLPIVAALNAENLTLLAPILHDNAGNVNTLFDIFLSKR